MFIHFISIFIFLNIYSYFFIYKFCLKNFFLFIKGKYFSVFKKVVFIFLIFYFSNYTQPFIFIYLIYKNFGSSIQSIDVKYQKSILKLVYFFSGFILIYFNHIYFFFFRSKKVVRPYTKELRDLDKKKRKFSKKFGKRYFSKMSKLKIPYSIDFSDKQLFDLSKKILCFKNPKILLLKSSDDF